MLAQRAGGSTQILPSFYEMVKKKIGWTEGNLWAH